MEKLTLSELIAILEKQNQSDLSPRLGVCRTSINKIISGERKPSKALLRKLGLHTVTVYEVISQEGEMADEGKKAKKEWIDRGIGIG